MSMPTSRAAAIASAVREEMVRSERNNVPSRSVATRSMVTPDDDASVGSSFGDAVSWLAWDV